MPGSINPHEALRKVGAFMVEHEGHGATLDIEPDRIILLCDCHSPPLYEVLTMDSQAMLRAAGDELAEDRAVSF